MTLNTFSQGNYVFENSVFEYLKKNETAKKYSIKSISYYPNFLDSINKGKCAKQETYTSKGNLIKVEFLPESNKPQENNNFIYDNQDNLKEIHGGVSGSFGSNIFILDYYDNNKLKSLIRKGINGNSSSDTMSYYYTNKGLFDYKIWSDNKSSKIYIRYNKCDEIEYVETLPYKTESIQLDSNGCVIYTEIEMGDDLIGKEKSFHRRTYNSNCQNLTDYTQYYFGDDWKITSETSEFDNNSRLIKVTSKYCSAKTKDKCLKKFRVDSIYKYEYDSKGLRIFWKEYDKKEELKSISFRKYEFF